MAGSRGYPAGGAQGKHTVDAYHGCWLVQMAYILPGVRGGSTAQARQFDTDKKHYLTPTERAAALKAVAGGLGKDSMERYFSAGQRTPPARERCS